MKKRVLPTVFAVMIALFSVLSLGGCTERSSQLKIYNAGEYMDPDVIDAFEEWYYEETKERVTVVYDQFDTVEQMYTKVQMSHADYDLICPSDYMVEQMISENLLLEVDKTLIDVEETVTVTDIESGEEVESPLIRQEYLDITKSYDPELKYSVPYMYGTFGIMYDLKKTGKHITSWEPLFGSEYKGKVYMKNSVREAHASAGIYLAREELQTLSNGFTDYGDAYKEKLKSIYADTSDKNIAAIKNLLLSQKKNLLKYDNDDAKFKMAQAAKSAGALGLFWSCDSGYVMGDYEDEDGQEFSGNKGLWYVVPEEGGNVYIDNFVIPKYAGNVKAANYFLKFICTHDMARLNSEYIGAISPVASAYAELYLELDEQEIDDEESFFYGTSEEWKAMYMDMMFPSKNTLDRCGIMRSFKGRANSAVIRMYADVVG